MKYNVKTILKNLDEIIAGGCIIGTISIVLVNVFTRYILNTGIYWTEEVATGLFVWSVFIGSAAAYKKHMHVGVDMIVKRLPPRGKFIVKIAVDFLLIVINFYITRISITYIIVSYRKVTPVLELSSAFISGSILVSFALMSIYAVYFFFYDLHHREARERYFLMTSFLPIIIVFILYFSSLPIAYSLFGATIFYFGFLDATSPTALLLQRFVTSTQSFPLLTIHFFVMAGSIMNYSEISNKLMAFADVLTGHLPGDLAQSNVLFRMLMGGVSGSANADAAVESKMLVPEMEARGFDKPFATAITAASSTVTPVIPPEINLIIYALLLVVQLVVCLQLDIFQDY